MEHVGGYTTSPFKSQIPGSDRPMEERSPTVKKLAVVVTSLSAMLPVSLLESKVSKTSISGIRKKSISTHSIHLGVTRHSHQEDRQDIVYECQETTGKSTA